MQFHHFAGPGGRRIRLRRLVPQISGRISLAHPTVACLRLSPRPTRRGAAENPKTASRLSLHWREDLRPASSRPSVQDDRLPHAARFARDAGSRANAIPELKAENESFLHALHSRGCPFALVGG